ncbi:hypothetical protein BLNAU_1830 [Blattamonas nauphoetae]|uniref:Uncharacterized protein n=1 Tax=Blattamonas nauphoetae TaxID=2049346 RepID=A0ABQ9YHR2_9EUKA|nr:hypothetical protein BLNAU_1830 [Blattamonas nauphoetae]
MKGFSTRRVPKQINHRRVCPTLIQTVISVDKPTPLTDYEFIQRLHPIALFAWMDTPLRDIIDSSRLLSEDMLSPCKSFQLHLIKKTQTGVFRSIPLGTIPSDPLAKSKVTMTPLSSFEFFPGDFLEIIVLR